MWKQRRTPNLDPVIYQNGKILWNWLGYCLAYVQTAFATGWAGNTAAEARNKVKLRTDAIPKGMYVPVWFTHWGTYGGVYKEWGHVGIYKDGTVWTSPYTNKAYADKLTIKQIESIYGATYKGWSTEFAGTTIVEYVNNNATQTQIKALYLEILERPADKDGLKHYSTRTAAFVRDDLLKSAERKKLLAAKEAARKKADEAAKKAEAARIAAEKAAEDKKKAEAAAKAKAEADRLAEIERKKKEEQAAQAPSWKDLADEQKKTNSLIQQIINLIKSIFNLGGK